MRFVPILIFVIDILVIGDILKTQPEVEKKLLWILAVIFLPVVGPVLYFALANRGRP